MTDPNRRQNLRLELERGDASLRAAEALLALALWDDAISRAYYAAFQWLRALLFTEGLEARTHAGTHDLFFQHFVATGRAPRELAKRFAVLQKLREQADYARAFRATEADAREQIAATGELHAWISAALAAGDWLAP